MIVNCDETAIYHEEPEKKIVDICGNKEIIDTEGSESKRVNILLSIICKW